MKGFRFFVRLHSANIFFAIVGPVRRAYRRTFHPATRGVKCVITCGQQVLLVRLNYDHGTWTLPGGGVKRREDWLAAALREVHEETGLTIGDARKVGEYFNDSRGNRDTVWVFQTELPEVILPIADGIEIAEAAWFDRNNLPADRGPRVDQILSLASVT